VVMLSAISYRSQDINEGLSSLGFLFSMLLLVSILIFLGVQFYKLIRYQRIKNDKSALEKFTQNNQGSLIAFEDFKDVSLLRQSFLFTLVLRDFLFSVILTTLFEHPLAQTIIILVLNLIILTFLFWKQPFKKIFGFIQQLFYEIVTLAVNISVIVLAAKDAESAKASDLRERIGKLVIVTNLVFNFTVIAFLIYGLIMSAKEYYQEFQAKKAKKSSSSNLHNRLPNETRQMEDSSYIQTGVGDFSRVEMIPERRLMSNVLHRRRNPQPVFKEYEASEGFELNNQSQNQFLFTNQEQDYSFNEAPINDLMMPNNRRNQFAENSRRRPLPSDFNIEQQQNLNYHPHYGYNKRGQVSRQRNHQEENENNFNQPLNSLNPRNNVEVQQQRNGRNVRAQPRGVVITNFNEALRKKWAPKGDYNELVIPKYIRGRHVNKTKSKKQ